MPLLCRAFINSVTSDPLSRIEVSPGELCTTAQCGTVHERNKAIPTGGSRSFFGNHHATFFKLSFRLRHPIAVRATKGYIDSAVRVLQHMCTGKLQHTLLLCVPVLHWE